MPFGVASSADSVRSAGALTQSSSMKPPRCPDVYIRRADIDDSLAAYERLLQASKAYTNTMLAMSKASSELAQALEDCSRVKGAHACGPSFQAACGLHYLKANYEQVLCDTFWKEFSIPLLSQLDVYRTTVRERQAAHEKAIAEKSRLLKDIEARHHREGKRRTRDLNSFRLMLSELQAKINELEELKAQHYTDTLEYEEQTWDFLASKVGLLVRAQIEIAERLSAKASSDPVLESVTAAIPDPFHTYGPPKREDQLFTILQPSTVTSQGLRIASEDASGAATSVRRATSADGRDDVAPASPDDNETRSTHDTLFTPRAEAPPHVPSAPPSPSRSFVVAQLHAQPSYGSLFGYRRASEVRTDDSAADGDAADELVASLPAELRIGDESPPRGKPPPPLSPQRHWPSDREMWE
ncbi:hypothetical protein MBRA1_003738 [Malassezia brasiliensis]|uniref:IVY1-phospholipid-binding protein n=1 Tax=Malassezia brasiliensis TaxID=1821822 RepID=A0AAF0DWZ5_9BASI|nr:hypothetical protein MBRA1_003738 [Malassezia brasiliensis]